MNTWRSLLLQLTLTLVSANPLAATPAQAAELGGSQLTPLGAERPGNADGTTPAWTGGITEPPAGYDPDRQHIDPFADDPVLFRISAANAGQFADRLSEGQKSLL